MSLSRWRIQDGGSWRDGFTVTDVTSGATTNIDYAFLGTNTTSSATWDFAPLGEMQEVDWQQFSEFRQRLHQDDNFVSQQVMMNRRQRIWHDQTMGSGTTFAGLHHVWRECLDTTDGQRFWITSDVRYGRNVPPMLARLHYRIDPLFRQIRWATRRYKERINKILKLNRSPEEILAEAAQRKSEQLLREWLSEKEYHTLMKLGELEIYNDDEIYIIKKNPQATVTVKKDGKEDEFCLITKEMGYCAGDVLLTKIMMLKTDPENFKKQAIKR